MMKFREYDFFLLRREDIQKATAQSYRQYFCGNLKRPQLLDYVQTESLEVGTSNYSVFTKDEPHYHRLTPDIIYVLDGEYHIWLLNGESSPVVLREGDFVSIPPNSAYASKAKAGTRTIFIKHIRESDKVPIEPSLEVKQWLEEKI